MSLVAGIDVGSTYTKAVLLDEEDNIASRAMKSTGFKLGQAAQSTFEEALKEIGASKSDVDYVISKVF